jgi:valyl-tRNA synthetase
VYGYFNKKAKSPFTDEQIGEFLPMSMRAQAHDIIRTWAFYTMIKTWMHHGVAPWKDIVISGHVLSDAKQKLSKSQGGGNRTPQALLDQYSADAIRYWTASGSLGTDVAFSEAQLKIGGRLATKLWNAFRFVGAHIEGVDPNRLPEAFGVVNEWLLHRATECFTRYRKYLGNYEFSLALEAAERFFWKDFCDTYLEMIKHQLFNQDAYKKEEIEATLWTLHTVGLRILQLYGPYMPHVTETIFTTLYAHGSQSLHQTKFEGAQQAYEFDKSKQVMERVLHIIAQVRKLKTEKALSLKAPLKKLTIYVEDARVIEQVQRQEQLIKGVVHADHIAYEVEPSAVVALRGSEDELHAHVSYQ